jgi:ABC-2 type transport system ATP-binding protein
MPYNRGMTVSAIEVEGLHKTFRSPLGRRKIAALGGVDFTVAPGELFGLLGPNGAGKTTAVKILLDLTRASSGRAAIEGIPTSDPSARRSVGYLPEGHRFPGYLTGGETLSIFGRMSGMAAADVARRGSELLERLRIGAWRDVKVKKYSKGMTQRLGLACAMIHDPRVLLLDEPTDGVDPVGRREIRDILREEAARGKAILLNSHLLSEIEMTCDRVAVLRGGTIAALGRIDELTERASQYRLALDRTDDALLGTISATGAGIERTNGHLHLTVRDVEHLNEILDSARASGALVHELSPLRSTLEDVFVGLVRAGDAEVGGKEVTE